MPQKLKQLLDAVNEIRDLCVRAGEMQRQPIWIGGPESDGSWTIRLMDDPDDIPAKDAGELIEKLSELGQRPRCNQR